MPSGSELINFLAHHLEKARASEEALRLTVETNRIVVTESQYLLASKTTALKSL